MSSSHKADLQRQIIQQGTVLLSRELSYTQVIIVRKLETIGQPVARSTFSHIITGKNVGPATLGTASRGIQTIVASELGMEWSGEGFVRTADENFQPQTIDVPEQMGMPTGFALYESGRLDIREKVDFFSRAKKEVIEFGVSLNSFSGYFFQRKYEEFRWPVEQLLERGVNFKCYLLHTKSTLTMKYFGDQPGYLSAESDFERKINTTVERLQSIQKDLAGKNLPGRFEVFQYDLIPSAHMLVIDGGSEMLVSPYMYGLRRADCPVLKFSKQHQGTLVKKYMESLRAMTKNAVRIIPSPAKFT